jgi:hypothetical protein
MSAILIFLVGGIGLGFGLGVIVGYFLGQRAEARRLARGFEVDMTKPPIKPSPGE